MNSLFFLVLWDDRTCVEIREFGDDSDACNREYNRIMEPINCAKVPLIRAQIYYASSREALGIYVGYELDDQYRDEFDWSTDMADGDDEG